MIAGMAACAGQEADTAAASYLTKEDITVNETIEHFSDPKVRAEMGEEIADQIIQITGQSCAMARMKESVFAILTYIREAKEAQELTGQIREKLQGITEVDGNSITLRMKYAVKVRSDDEMTDENIYERALREIIG